ncbi:hypothetical protein [Stigmatella aurantiaca]|nr:hypothetical protein [Stigmatella aurantiaca]
MAFRWQTGVMGLAVLTSMALQACASTPERSPTRVSHHGSGHREREVQGYGGSGFASNVNLEVARQQCEHVARDFKRYSRVSSGRAFVSGPDTATVQLYVGRPYSSTTIDCTYDARAGSAYVP